ncbi:bifunctional helix-turn-helix domain-containing protein/methylated-DNA--[protein]-cysteine S-methyltransferase [Mucilaginibacter sabulilitoris]|uniref:Bifunctional helix-turn-helix domain-containing protein/methylated-DNA--[protein]-cysteine S-methyltransferase n=1 Tax=Mucilaginibacter sabulilitoris TaxID=1173583 RepID=A0ABZ0TQ76_9SPHI|nr:bifunctional helix-turn-helix domain-containing protein/methylated-DNA--[protein]-cysteine S-methyltransferase [Mucilaginibacter sabulilitoris]WPU95049.1 bifunctional helix-turn-helix domain-containing protein/methylated-DNA--[protein]-cysteine S-methyltransferase [Mucilaginibacter sabulilitoris]
MKTQQEIDYNRIAEAISFFRENFKSQPSLDDVAEHVHLSPFHFQRMFLEWAGVTPKQFLQYLSIEHAKEILKNTNSNLFETAFETGLSGTGRLHDLFIKVEGMTPGEYKNGGSSLQINYSFADTPFGKVIVASTNKGICHMAFVDEGEELALEKLKANYPNAAYSQLVDRIQQNALFIFTQDWSRLDEIKLHLKGTDFQIKVWETLLKVPPGGLTTYGDLAKKAGFEKASRAVGTSVGNNPVAFLIPCHRVIKSTGEIGQYHWGSARKNAIIGWEAALQRKAS